jgi:single-strand DNA-binding protein
MKKMNNVSIIGRITKDVELRATTSGLPAVSMFIAINNGKDKDGNERPADFPKVYVYDKQAENVNEYCHKGSLVGITGRIKTRTWDKEDGTKGYETYILASRVQFLDTKASEGAGIPEPDYVPSKEEKEENDPFADFGESVEISDDDLPF